MARDIRGKHRQVVKVQFYSCSMTDGKMLYTSTPIAGSKNSPVSLTVIQEKNGRVNFKIQHSQIVEGVARISHYHIPLLVREDDGPIFQIAKNLHEDINGQLIVSNDPIRDGRNYLYIMPKDEGGYCLVFARDMGSNVRTYDVTNVEMPEGIKLADLLENRDLIPTFNMANNMAATMEPNVVPFQNPSGQQYTLHTFHNKAA